MPLLIFTDLDGSLMEHESYSIEPAKPVLQTLKFRQIPIVFNTSKTAKEIEAVQLELGYRTQYICENGAALHNSDNSLNHEFATPRKKWLNQIHALREQENYLFSGFHDWPANEISELTGLNSNQAALSKIREYSEPILWRDSVSARQKFELQLKELGLKLLEGGRFLSIQSDYDKSTAIGWMKAQRIENSTNELVITIALGDSPNDEAMLNCADVAVVIKSAKSDRISVTGAHKIIRTKRPGPAGWQDAMTEILSLYDSGQLISTGSIVSKH